MILALLLLATPQPLDNGVSLITLPRPGPRWAELQVDLQLGTDDDPVGKTGMALLIGQLLRDALGESFDVEVRARRISVRGGALPSELLATLEKVRRALDALSAPQDKALTRAQKRAAQQRALQQQRSAALGARALRRSLGWPRRPLLNDSSELMSITAQELRAHATRADLRVGVAGALPEGLRAQLATWPQRARAVRPEIPAARSSAAAMLLVDKPGASFAQLFIGRIAEPSPEMRAASYAIAGSLSARINSALRKTPPRSLAVPNFDGALYTVQLTSPQAGLALKRILDACSEIREKGLSPQELQLARAQLSSGLEGKDALSALRARMRAAPAQTPSAESIQRAAKALCTPGAIVVVGDASASLKASLVPLGKVSIIGYDQL